MYNQIEIGKSTREDIYRIFGNNSDGYYNPGFSYPKLGIGFIVDQENWSNKLVDHKKEVLIEIFVFEKIKTLE